MDYEPNVFVPVAIYLFVIAVRHQTTNAGKRKYSRIFHILRLILHCAPDIKDRRRNLFRAVVLI